ncbi:MAG: epoxyqueuosine reductase [Anaerolineae bacterium]|nr:epoxyqueuosine reductase [Anaerolineae bacterium]
MPSVTSPTQHAAWITTTIQSFCDGPQNTLQDTANEKAWGTPLVGFCSGADPLYEQYKEVVGPFHWTPAEIFGHTFPDSPVDAAELTVISWILPQTQATKANNRNERVYPAERWARSRIFGETFNNKLRQHVVDALRQAGYQAVAPMLSPEWQSKQSEKFVFSSTWSERHTAYAAGLGTFGLCDGLITPVGKAMRTGSVVARLSIPPTPRPYTDHRAYCLFYSQGTCGKCIDRCPVGALSKAGHDKVKCSRHLNPTTANYVKENYGFDGYGCGLCQTGVPCESGIPGEQDGS